jgi:hypothetical protein
MDTKYYILTDFSDATIYKMFAKELNSTPLATFINGDKSSLDVNMTSNEILVGAYLTLLPETSEAFDKLVLQTIGSDQKPQ